MITPLPLSFGKSSDTSDGRFQTVYLEFPQLSRSLEGRDVIEGLTQAPKVLPPKYFYDDRGSQLFEQICDLPEYYPTRTEAWILQHYAPEIAEITGPCQLIELGSGSSTKTRLLLDAYQAQGYPLHYQPIDVSAGILAESAAQLLTDYPTLQVQALVGTYEQALTALPSASAPRLLMFLGSSLGNFTPWSATSFLPRSPPCWSRVITFCWALTCKKTPPFWRRPITIARG
ncbi:MAG: L-histidine N(alpha)-methyltransferase [Nodosilinea sp. LVE1205-7]|jgi:dimethylhistidine N-methyltransferase